MSASDADSKGQSLLSRENAEAVMSSLKPEAVDAAVQELFADDGEFSAEIYGAFADLANAYAKLIGGFAESLESLPTERRSELIREAWGKIDGQALGEAANAVSRLMIKVHQENPELPSELYPAIEKAVEVTDFGKLRVGMTAAMDYWSDILVKVMDSSVNDPVVVANLMGMISPLANDLIRVVSHALAEIELPSEVLASATFNILLSIDRKELGSAVTSLSRLINELHQGNLILGRDEPRFRAVFAQFSEELLENVDTEELARAVVSIGEDFEVILDSTTDLLHRDPKLLMLAGSTFGSLLNVMLRGLSNFLLEFSQLPDEVLFEIGEDIRATMEIGEITRILNLSMMLSNRFLQVNPGLYDDFLTAAVTSVDTEQFVQMFKTRSSALADVLGKDPKVQKALEPEEIGRRFNDMLSAFNRYMAERADTRVFLTRLFDSIDTDELETAVHNTVGTFNEAFFASADRALAVVRPMLAGAWKAAKSLAVFLARKITG